MQSVKRLYSVALLAFVSAGGCWSGQRSTDAPQGSIQRYAEKAKQRGENSITIPGPIGIHEEIDSLDQALSTYEVVVGVPISSVTEIVDRDHVYTFYRIRILEHLIRHPNRDVPAARIPDSLKPLQPNEVVIGIPAGTVTVDDVKVAVVDQDEHLLDLNSKYLLFLSPDNSGKYAYIRAGANALYKVTPDDKVVPLVPKPESPLQQDLEASTAGTLEKMRAVAKAQASQNRAQ
jgi:hypothetical protein